MLDGDVVHRHGDDHGRAVDDAPLAVDDTVDATEDTPLCRQPGRTNDTASGDGGNVWAVATGATNGTVLITNRATGAFTYTPNANYNGADAFTYTITDARRRRRPPPR